MYGGINNVGRRENAKGENKMATVKFDEGTKFETSLNLEDGEGVLFVRPPKNLIINFDKKNCQVCLVVTNKRVVTIPYPKFSGKYNTVSFYLKDIKSAQAKKANSATEESSGARFSISLKQGSDKTNCSGDTFIVGMEVNVLNIFKSLVTNITENDANNPWTKAGLEVYMSDAKTAASRTQAEASGASHYTEYSPNYAGMAEAAKAKLAKLDFSQSIHAQIRDYIVDLINTCVEAENK
jgi:hypothetical protein